MIRLGPDTEVRMGELEDRRYLVQIAAGTTTFRVLRDSGADVEISTPTVSVRPAEQGSYRVTVFPDGTTEITVRAGRAEIFSPRGIGDPDRRPHHGSARDALRSRVHD